MKTTILATTETQAIMKSLRNRLSQSYTEVEISLFLDSSADLMHDKLIAEIENSTHVIADISESSTTVGYLLAIATQKNKAILCLHRSGAPTDIILISALVGKAYINDYETLADAVELSTNFLGQ